MQFLPSFYKMVKKIGTHDGVFHCDDVFACFMLKLLPQYRDAEIVRTRDDKILETCDIVVDVGGVYDDQKLRFDHHQRGFDKTMSTLKPGKPWDIKLSSAGLVYCHFGHDILKQLIPDANSKTLEVIYDLIYEKFVKEIDAIDNGVSVCEGEQRYKIFTNLSTRVAHLNPPWNCPKEDLQSMSRFEKAMNLAGEEFKERVMYAANCWWPARSIVFNAVQKEARSKINKSMQILELETRCPWKEHYFDIMKELNEDPTQINFVIFQDKAGWRVEAVPSDPTSFVGKIFLSSAWRGRHGDELIQASGIEGCIFVHASGFIGGNVTREGAIQMAVKSISEATS